MFFVFVPPQDSGAQVLALRSQVHSARVDAQTASDAAVAATSRADAAERQVGAQDMRTRTCPGAASPEGVFLFFFFPLNMGLIP